MIESRLKELLSNTKLKVWEDDFYFVSVSTKYKEILKKLNFDFFSFIQEEYQLTLILSKDEWEKIKNKIKNYRIQKDYKLITFDVYLTPDVIGFIATIAEILAKNNISILIVSSFSKDHVLVKKSDLSNTLKVLENFINKCKRGEIGCKSNCKNKD